MANLYLTLFSKFINIKNLYVKKSGEQTYKIKISGLLITAIPKKMRNLKKYT